MHKYSLQPTTELKNYRYFSENAQKEKVVLKVRKFKKKKFNTAPFPLTLQACIPYFLTSLFSDVRLKKNVSFECSELVGS